MMKKKILAGLAVAGMAIATNASALFLYPVSNIQDINREFMSLDLDLDGNLDVGDRLRGVFTIDTIDDAFGPGSQNLGITQAEELTAVFEVEVTSKVGPAGDIDYTFGAVAGGVNGLGAGATVALYNQFGPNLDINACASIAACEGAATDGNLWMVAGFGDADDQWEAEGVTTDNLAAIALIPGGVSIGDFNLLLSVLVNNTGYDINQQDVTPLCGILYTCAGDGLVDIIANGQLKGGQGLANGYQARSNFAFQVAAVPEPAGVALLGLGLLGLARKMRKTA